MIIGTKFVVPKIYESVIELINSSQGYITDIINKFSSLPEDSFLKKDFLEQAISKN